MLKVRSRQKVWLRTLILNKAKFSLCLLTLWAAWDIINRLSGRVFCRARPFLRRFTMKKCDSAAQLLEKLFWAFLFINPFLDIINGIYINTVMGVDVLDVKFTSTLGVTPSLVVRMLMLLVFAAYVLIVRDTRSIITALPIGAAWILSMASEYLSTGSAQLFLDAQYTARFCYNIVLLMVYTRVFSKKWGMDGRELIARLNDIAAFTLLILSFSILISAVVGVGYSTYADRLGYRGSRGFFYAGNDITAVLALLLPLCVAALMQLEIKKSGALKAVFYAVSAGFGANALVIIGSKTAFIAFGVTFALMLAAAVISFFRRGIRGEATGFLLALCSALVVFAILMLLSDMQLWQSIVSSYSVTGQLAETEGMSTALLSGRQNKLSEHFSQYSSGGALVWLFGLGRGGVQEILEMDVFEVIFYYGIFGAAAMLWLYAKAAIDFFKAFLRRRDVMTAALFASLAMCSGYLFIAGHILFSVTSGFYFIFVIAYSRAYFAQSGKEALLWKS